MEYIQTTDDCLTITFITLIKSITMLCRTDIILRKIPKYFKPNVGFFCKIMSVPNNIVMDLIIVMNPIVKRQSIVWTYSMDPEYNMKVMHDLF